MLATACPDDFLLQSMLEGAAPSDESLSIHVGSCPACQERIERLCAPSPSLIVGLQTKVPEIEPAYANALKQLLSGVESGRQLGEYRLLGAIGRGGMATVFRALHVRLEKTVAIKLVGAERGHDPGLRAMSSSRSRVTAPASVDP